MSDEPPEDRRLRADESRAPRRRREQERRGAPSTHVCDLCGAPMLEVHCKLACQRCGYTRDCSDP